MSETTERKGLFGKFAEVDDAIGSGDLTNFDLKVGDNKIRILSAPVLVRKHWDLPESSDLKGSVPCRKFITDPEAYAKDPEGYLASLPHCEYCDWSVKVTKDEAGTETKESTGFYTVKHHWVFNGVQDGEVKVADFYQTSILRAINNFENDKEWAPLMPNGTITDIEIVIKKEQTGPKAQNVKYSVTGVPTSKPLEAAQLENYRKKAVDIVKLKMPPAMDDEGNKAWAELLTKACQPKPGEKPKKLS